MDVCAPGKSHRQGEDGGVRTCDRRLRALHIGSGTAGIGCGIEALLERMTDERPEGFAGDGGDCAAGMERAACSRRWRIWAAAGRAAGQPFGQAERRRLPQHSEQLGPEQPAAGAAAEADRAVVSAGHGDRLYACARVDPRTRLKMWMRRPACCSGGRAAGQYARPAGLNFRCAMGRFI